MKLSFQLALALACLVFSPNIKVEAQGTRGGPSLEAATTTQPVVFSNTTFSNVDVVENAKDIIPALDTLQPSEVLGYVDWLEVALINLLVYLSAFIPGLNQIKTKSRAISIGLLVAYGFFQFKAGFFRAALSYFGSRKIYDWVLVNIIPTDKIPFWLRAFFSQPTAPAE